MRKPGVFISYRRDTGSHLAGRISDYLEANGFDPFMDVVGLGSGHFDQQIFEEIGRREHFVLVCTGDALARCAVEGDWVRSEIAHAIKTGRNIVPVVDSGFRWPDRQTLPGDIADVCSHHAFEYSHTHWKATCGKFLERLRSVRVPPRRAAPPRDDPPSRLPTGTSVTSGADDGQASRHASSRQRGSIVQTVELCRLHVEDTGTPESLRELATALESLARARLSQRKLEEAVASGMECMGIRRALIAGGPGDAELEQELASIIRVVAQAELAHGSASAAVGLLRELVEHARAVQGRLPDESALPMVNDALRELAEAQVIAGDLAGARVSCEERVALARRYAKVVGVSKGRRDVSEALEALARVELALGEGERALRAAAESLEIRRRRVIEHGNGGSVALELAATLGLVSDIRLSMDSREEALESLREAAESVGHSVRGSLGATANFRALALLLFRVAQLEIDRGDLDGACSTFNKSFSCWNQVLRRDDFTSEDIDAIARLLHVRARSQVDVDLRLVDFAEQVSAAAGRLRLSEQAADGGPLGSRAKLGEARVAVRKLLEQVWLVCD